MMDITLLLLLFLTGVCGASALGSPYAPVAENKIPMIVIGNTNEALAAAMSLCASDVIRSTGPPKLEDRRSPIPPSQPILFFSEHSLGSGGEASRRQQQRLPSETVSSLQNAILFLGPSLDGYEKILASSLQLSMRISERSPILHTSIKFGCEEGSKTMHSLSVTRDRFSALGLNLKTNNLLAKLDNENGILLSRESADEWGTKLQELLDGSQSRAAVTMDVRTHLAMLQANSLPRSRGVLGEEKDVWAIGDTIQDGMCVDNGDGMLLQYEFDYADPFGGCDPLLCPSAGTIIPSPISPTICSAKMHSEANEAFAAAYSATVGSGMDPLRAVCVATSVKAIFGELGKTGGDGIFHPPSYAWSVIDWIAEGSIQAMQNVRQENGLSRKMYKEFGYR